MSPRRRLIWQLGLSAAGIIAILGTWDLAHGRAFSASIEAGACFVAVLSAYFAKRGRDELGANLLVGTLLLLIAAFDSGFFGSGDVWCLYIPTLLLAFITDRTDRPLRSIGWLGVAASLMLLTNLTELTPKLVLLDPPGRWNSVPHFLCAAAATWACLRCFQQEHAKLLRESHELALDLRSALNSAERASQAKSDFLSHMSHEFRTPLNAISGFAQLLLQNDSSPSEAAENLQAIRTSADHLVHLIGDVLDLSRMEHGKLVLAKTAFQPIEQMQVVHSILLQAAREKGLSIEMEIASTSPWIEGDPLRWRQILLNLGSNAIKYTDTGAVLFRLAWEARDAESGVLTIHVADTGPGIAQQDQKAIFERFRRLAAHETGPVGGAGLGLSIARDLVDAMGGTLDLESQVGLGSTFIISIPARIAAKPAKPSSDTWTSPWNPKGYRILLCEDNRLNVRLATQVLTRLGVEHAVAYDGQAALELLAQESFDIVLLDLHMPRRSGFEVASSLRCSNPPHPLHDIPILALTADASEETRRRTREAGMDDFLAKPFHLPELEERLRRLLRHRPPASSRST